VFTRTRIRLTAADTFYSPSYTISWSDGTGSSAHGPGVKPNRPSALAALAHGSDMRTIERKHITTRIYSLRLTPQLAVQVARSMEPEEDALHGLLAFMLLGSAASIALAGAGGWFVAGKSLAPVVDAFERQQVFVADASHELRTPLAVIRANAEYLQQEQPESEEASEILTETDRLTVLVDSLLALARGQGGATADRPLDLGELVTASAQSLQPLAADRKIALDVETVPGLEVRGNPDQLRQLVVILVDNALRYTPEGGRVTVAAHRNDGTAVVAVKDTGIGIDRAALKHVFERFYRADEARNRADAGAGLGLSIAEQLVTDHGGRIAAESAPGRGSTFTVSLPLGHGD
jgi:signal transduction histidine kinase